jgi:hypothetical protein
MNLAYSPAGDSSSDQEKIQKNFDKAKTILVGSGQIDAQRLTGYKTADGIWKIFFYDPHMFLSCVESKNLFNWHISDNF